MKRALLSIIILLLILPIAIAQEIPEENQPPARGINDIDQGVQNDILIPNSLQYIARVIFRMQGPVFLSDFVIMSCLFLIVYMFAFNMARASDFPGGKTSSIVIITLIVLIGSASGGLLLVSRIYFNALYRIPLFDEYNFLGLALTAILFIFALWWMKKLSAFTKKEAEFEKGYEEGLELNRAQRFVKKLAGADK